MNGPPTSGMPISGMLISVPPPSQPIIQGLISERYEETTRVGEWKHIRLVETNDIDRRSIRIFHEYQKSIVFTDTSYSLDLEFREPFELQRVSLAFSGNLSKTFTVDIYAHKNGGITSRIFNYSKHKSRYYEDTEKRVYLLPMKINFDFTKVKLRTEVDVTVLLREFVHWGMTS